MAIKSFKDINKRNQDIINRIVSTEYPTSTKFINLSGQDFGNLHVDSYYGKDKRGHKYYWCTCKCGSTILCRATHLKDGSTTSCGCLMSKASALRGHINKYGTKHKMYATRLYYCWSNMIQRCTNPNNRHYQTYGAQGITVCDEWKKFENFMEWALHIANPPYNDSLTIDRIDPYLGYFPENCRWVTQKVQGNNKKDTYYLQIMTYVFPITIWSEITGLHRETIKLRKQAGWTDAEALLTPPHNERNKKQIVLYIPPEYEIYNKYNEFVNKGIIEPYKE